VKRSRQRRLAVAGIVLLLLALGVGALSFYYRPTVEYAYVDVVDFREKPLPPGWFVMPLVVVLVGVSLIVVAWRLIRRRSRI